MRLVYFLVLWPFLVCCTIDRDKTVDRDKFSFTTYDDTELFFKNVRQLYYDVEEHSEAKIQIFRFEKRSTEADYPLINVAIVMNWLQDRAYVLTEPNDIAAKADTIYLYWESIDLSKGTIVLNNPNRDGMLEFASQVYEGILAQYKFYLVAGQDTTSVLDRQQDREAFRITMSDYYRLTRVF